MRDRAPILVQQLDLDPVMHATDRQDAVTDDVATAQRHARDLPGLR